MVGRQGENRVADGKKTRNRVLTALMQHGPMHFSELKRKLKISAATLTGHLHSLTEEGCLKRRIEGRKIVYVVATVVRSVRDMRKDCFNELGWLVFRYNVCLTDETRGKFDEALKVLKESFESPEPDAVTRKIMQRHIEIPEGTVKVVVPESPFEPVKFVKEKKERK